MQMGKRPVGKPPRDPNTQRLSVHAYLTPEQMDWFKAQGKGSDTIIAMIVRSMKNASLVEDINVSIEIKGKTRVYRAVDLIM